MFFPKLKVGAGIAGATFAASMLVATPAQALITPFASFKAYNPNSSGAAPANVIWTKTGTTSGTFNSKTNTTGVTPAATYVTFSFADPALSSVVHDITAMMVLTSTGSGAATTAGRNLRQSNIAGSLVFTTLSAITLYGKTFAAGSNLLTATFSAATLTGSSANASFSDATSANGSIAYSSDFLSFLPTVDKDFSVALTSISPGISRANANSALNTFSAVASGNFSGDPAPRPSFPVPEAATWAMFICGFGLMGATLRRRRPELSLV
jgi:hypothetical protein